MNQLIQNQNSPELIKLLKASTVAYRKAKKGEIRVTYFLIFLALAYPISYILIKDETVKLSLFGCSFLLTVLVQIFTDRFKGNTTTGALLKEEFDTSLFQLPWKSTLHRIDHAIVSSLSVQYKGKEIRDWYSPGLSESVPYPISVAILQHSNTSWDIELRKSYRNALVAFLVIYSMILWVCLVAGNADGKTIFSIYFSILSFYTHFITQVRGHTAVIQKRKGISQQLDAIVRNRKQTSLAELRDIQDEIYITRQESAKVPDFYFQWYKKRCNAAAEDYIDAMNSTYNGKA